MNHGKLYVGNISWGVGNDELQELMETIGEVSHCEILMVQRGKGPPRSKGYALVEYVKPEDAEQAIAKLNDTVLDNRPIWVREDRGPSKVENNNNNNNGGGYERNEGKGNGGGEEYDVAHLTSWLKDGIARLDVK